MSHIVSFSYVFPPRVSQFVSSPLLKSFFYSLFTIHPTKMRTTMKLGNDLPQEYIDNFVMEYLIAPESDSLSCEVRDYLQKIFLIPVS